MFKDIAENLFEKEKGNYLNNINEKRDLTYTDSTLPEKKHLDEIIGEIADYYASEWEKYKFAPEDIDEMHFFLTPPNEWKDKLGHTNICVCPYKGFVYGPWLTSNYMWSEFDDNASLFIDIYGCNGCDKEYISKAIIQELYNFMRDAEWVLDGIYEAKMLAMEKETDNIDAALEDWIEKIKKKED